MRALRFNHKGNLNSLHVADVAQPERGRDEVVIQVRAAGINPSDVKNVLGMFPHTTVPRTPGRDFAGIVTEGPTTLVGKEVWGTLRECGFTRDGTHAEYVTLPAEAIIIKPKSISFQEAAAAGVPYLTAWNALERTSVKPGSTVVIIGAAGAVGGAATMLAQWWGARVVGAVLKEQREEVESAGIPAIPLTDGAALGPSIRDYFPKGADVIFDTTGAWVSAAVSGMANHGRIATTAAPPSGHIDFPLHPMFVGAGSLVGVNSMLCSWQEVAMILGRVAEALSSGKLAAPQVRGEYPIEAAINAYHAVNQGAGKSVILFP